MKNLFLLLLILFFSICQAQIDCKPYVPTSVGVKWEITNYSAKAKETGKTTFELVDKVEIGNKLTFTIKAVSYDNKGKETFTNQYDAYCINGKFNFDMSFMIDGAAMQSYQNMNVDIDASEYEIPSMTVQEGATLKDGSLVVSVGTNEMAMFKMTILVTDRKIGAKEEKTTPAGTFSCLQMSQKVSTKMVLKVEGSSKEWYAEEVGLVRSESYNKKGKLTGYSELTKIEKN